MLFICTQNLLRSPTAERIFSDRVGLEVASAGVAADAVNPVSAELVQWADLIFVMEKRHRDVLFRRFRRPLQDKRVVCLDIPDEFDFMDPVLVRLLEAKAGPLLPVEC